ncbi:MAG: ribosome silencing factor [Pelagibacterales bacterium]|jgi:ribosome-associated protein|nr:ribosome silencing factor [Pelagibacterales bacterium]MBT3939073.1 ribosome silencing factor [Pelagibacterales bacterium]MBT4109715.1 ribosome silencing factor [Pelagibacterales bacterium]MDG2267542.1 ribosome silencing factor [Alphaproteobacteria bacterium]|tara:strand:- start:97 stop:447 length:351 start_codon:yes stop_codon:yes gene_type:complete
MENKKLNNSIEKILNDGKAEDIISIPLKGKSSIADYMIIANGSSTRHVSALSNQVSSKLKTLGYQIFSIEGQRSGDWVLVDAGDVIVHLFRPEVRDFYNLDKMWLAPKDKAMEENL